MHLFIGPGSGGWRYQLCLATGIICQIVWVLVQRFFSYRTGLDVKDYGRERVHESCFELVLPRLFKYSRNIQKNFHVDFLAEELWKKRLVEFLQESWKKELNTQDMWSFQTTSTVALSSLFFCLSRILSAFSWIIISSISSKKNYDQLQRTSRSVWIWFFVLS